MANVVVIGSFNVDHVWTVASLPRPGETLSGEYRSGPGGKGFNQATAAARAGADTLFVCALGDDVGGQLARVLAAADGIALHGQRSEAPTGTAGIFVDASGRNSIVIGPGANATLSPVFVEQQAAALADARMLLGQLETPENAIAAAFVLARNAGVTTVLNPAPADAMTSTDLLALTDVLTPNESEFCAQLEHHTGECVDPDTLAAQSDAILHALCRRLLPHGSVVITLGAAGCFVSHAESNRRGDAAHYRMPAEAANVVDTTGAGDAFNGALVASMASAPDAAFAMHIRFANRFAALSTETAGAAASMPRLAQVVARFGTT